MTSILIFSIHTVGGNLKPVLFQKHRHSSVGNAGIHSSVKQDFYLLRLCGSGNIPVIRRSSKKRIPDTASDVFDRYNQLQQSQGFDLAQYAGKTVQQFVYEISNEAQEGPVYATVLVYKETIIGGDVSSAATGGVMHGFART